MNQNVFIVDRDDQVCWYVDPEVQNFTVQIQENHAEIRRWLINMTKDVVVISGQGKMPRPGTSDHVGDSLFYHVRRHQYRIWFSDADDAMLFKLTYG
jgi:hypothetical protein